MSDAARSSRTVGQRLAEARKARAITQEDAAATIGVSRPTFIAIEKGDRPAKPTELVQLASLYGQPVSHFVRSVPPLPDLQPHFRAPLDKLRPEDVAPVQQAIFEFKRFLENYLDLELRLKSPLRRNDSAPVILHPRINPVELAEDVALRERQRLGLGDHPLPDLRRLLESEVGVRIFLAKLPTQIAGLYLFLEDLGGCLLINSRHPPEQQRASIAHEYAHLIVDRHTAGIDSLAPPARKPLNERFAESFAMSFLMPAASVRFRFHETVNATGNFQVADLVKLKHFYGVSLEAMTLRLESLGLLKSGTWDLLKEKRIPVRQAEKRLGLASDHPAEPPYPERYKFLAVQAYERGDLSEKELANYLGCDIWEARRVVQESLVNAEVDAAGETLAIEADFNTPLLSNS